MRTNQRLLVVVLLFASVRDARGVAFVPMTVENLSRSSAAIVVGTVERLAGVERRGKIATMVGVHVEEVLKGALSAPDITLTEAGGVVGRRREVLVGSPSFSHGERVLLFVRVRADGSLQTNQLALGKFRIQVDSQGMPEAVQDFGRGSLVIASPMAVATEPLPLGDLLAAIARGVGSGVADPAGPLPSGVLADASEPSAVQEITSAFTFLGYGRFFEPDEARPLSFLVDERGDSILGLAASRRAVDDALAAWTNVPSAAIVLQDGGLTDDPSAPCSGPHKVRFDDPDDQIPDPVDCSGMLAMGGYCTSSDEAKTFGGITFIHATRAALTFGNGWEGCATWNPCNIAEIATHEIGHAIGLGHSSENEAEPDPVLRDATMFFLAHFDGRCANVRIDDINGISFLYPVVPPPSITSRSPLPTGTVSKPYHTRLAVQGGTRPYTWAVQGGGFPGLALSSDGLLSGTPTAIGKSFFRITASDGKGDSHTKSFDVAVGAVPPCVGDCDADGSVTVAELITGVSIALGTLPLDACPVFDSSGDDAVTVDELLHAVNAAANGCGS